MHRARTTTDTNAAVPTQKQRPEERDVQRVQAQGVPRLPRTYVPRTRLWSQLDRTVAGSMTLLVAPAGAGKSLGVAGWLQQPIGADDLRHGLTWVQADRTWAGPRVSALLDVACAPPPDAAAGTPPTPTLVVFDDAHLLPSSALHVLDDRLSAAPESMRVLLLSRWDLPLNRLVPELLGHFSIVRGDLLRLDDEEGAILVTEHARTSAPEVIEAITAYAQGWCAAVVLASRAVASTPDPVAAAHRYAQREGRYADRIASEVFSALRPHERHLLLCTANEGVVSVESAVHLTHDDRAGEILTDLGRTGLLVTRLGDETPGAEPSGSSAWSLDPEPTGHYRIHPLLAEVVRRRVAADGVDVERARATVLRAVRLDVARGDTRDAFRRLVDMHELDAAAERLAVDGHLLLMQGQGPAIQTFERHHAQTVAAHPETWFFLLLERWLNGDVNAATHWMDRLLAGPPVGTGTDGRYVAQVACVRLMRGRMGLESLPSAVAHAEALVGTETVQEIPRAALPHLLCELGHSQIWLDRLPEAEATLSNAFRLAHDANMAGHVASAMTHLATAFYLQGRESACRKLAGEALDLIAQRLPWGPGFAAHRAQLVLQLATMSTLPWPTTPAELPTASGPVHSSDLTARFWGRVRDARLALVEGSVMNAERTLQAAFYGPELPEHLRTVVIIERAFLAALSDDRKALADLIEELDPSSRPGEVALLQGLAADLAGDQRAAADHFATAADQVRLVQPPCRALALTCEAQLLDALGQTGLALDVLQEAVTITEVRRNAVPFLGWSRHGTSIHVLLARLHVRSSEPWLAELTSATEGHPGIAAVLGPWTATVRERATAPQALVVPVLSPRERDVLHELARGATYADIAAELYVSENTVKTHVSSLYSKLAATRRSEALAVARNLNLL